MMLDVLQQYMALRGFAFQRLDGNIRNERRRAALDHFNAPVCSEFCKWTLTHHRAPKTSAFSCQLELAAWVLILRRLTLWSFLIRTGIHKMICKLKPEHTASAKRRKSAFTGDTLHVWPILMVSQVGDQGLGRRGHLREGQTKNGAGSPGHSTNGHDWQGQKQEWVSDKNLNRSLTLR